MQHPTRACRASQPPRPCSETTISGRTAQFAIWHPTTAQSVEWVRQRWRRLWRRQQLRRGPVRSSLAERRCLRTVLCRFARLILAIPRIDVPTEPRVLRVLHRTSALRRRVPRSSRTSSRRTTAGLEDRARRRRRQGPIGEAQRRSDRRRPGPVQYLCQPLLLPQASYPVSPDEIIAAVVARCARSPARMAGGGANEPAWAPHLVFRPTLRLTVRGGGARKSVKRSCKPVTARWPPRPASQACPSKRYSTWPSSAWPGRAW